MSSKHINTYMTRDRHRQLTDYHNSSMREQKENELKRNLRKEVNTGGHGTRDYVIKEGPNKGKIADKGQ